MTAVPGMDVLLDEHGEWDSSRTCGCCGQKKVFVVRYDDVTPKDNGRFLACQKCDRTVGKA